MYVGVGCFYAFVPEPKCNHGNIHAALKQCHRGAVANHLGGDALSLEAWATAQCSLYRFAKQEVDGKARKWVTSAATGPVTGRPLSLGNVGASQRAFLRRRYASKEGDPSNCSLPA